MITMLISSCVQMEMCDELYGDYYGVLSPRNKMSKDVSGGTPEYSCGVCSAAYIKSGMPSNLNTAYMNALSDVVYKSEYVLHLPYQFGTGLTASQETSLLNSLGLGTWNNANWVDYTEESVISCFVDGSYPKVVMYNTGAYYHWVVAQEYISEEQKGLLGKKTEPCSKVKCFDPQMNCQRILDIKECVIFCYILQ